MTNDLVGTALVWRTGAADAGSGRVVALIATRAVTCSNDERPNRSEVHFAVVEPARVPFRRDAA